MREMRVLKTLCLLAAVLLSGPLFAAGKCERLVATGNPEYPPYLWRDPQSPQHLIGANADLLALIGEQLGVKIEMLYTCLLYTSPSPRDKRQSRMPSSA